MTHRRAISLTRREALLAGMGSAALGLVPPQLWGAAAEIAATDLGDDLVLYSGAGGNVVGLKSVEGLLLVDSGRAEHSKALLAKVQERQGKGPVRYLLNTHWHLDHTGANDALGSAGAKIVAHENTRLWMGQQIISKWESRTYPPRQAQARPTDTFFYDSKRLAFGGAKVEYGYLPQAHTDGDIYVYFPRQNVLVAGDVVTGGRYPLVDYCTNGWLGGMIDGLRTVLAKCNEQTRIVPGTGALRTRADATAQREMCITVLQRIGESYYKGQTWEEFLSTQPTREFDAQWGSPDLFLHTSYEAAWYHITEVRRPFR